MSGNDGEGAGFASLLRGHEYMNLTTFRKDGRPVKTPVWFAKEPSGDAGVVYVYTMGDSGKVKRIRNDGRVLVGPCDRRGGALGQEGPAVARVLPPAEEEAAAAAMDRKYGLKKRAFGLLVRALGKAKRQAYLGIAPAPDGPAARATGAPPGARGVTTKPPPEEGVEGAAGAKGEGARRADDRRARTERAPPLRVGWALDVLFVAGSTLVLAEIGGLVGAGALPWVVPGEEANLLGEFYGSLPAWGRAAFAAYVGSAALLGLVLPAAALLAWGCRDAAVRGALAPYALLLLCQVLVEFAFARVFFPNIVIFAGLIYTAYRVWQLRRARKAFPTGPRRGLPRRAARGLLVAGLAFWSVNLVFLLAVMTPRVTRI